MFLTDTHAHIHFDEMIENKDDILANAYKNNIKRIFTIGIDLKDSLKAIEFAEKHRGVYASVGVHPHDAKDYKLKDQGSFEKLADSKKVIAIGEVGLDFYRNNSPEKLQIDLFSLMLDTALEKNLPVIIHARQAADKIIDVLSGIIKDIDHKILFHCFSGEKNLIRWGLDRDNVKFSFAGNLTYPKAQELRDAAKSIPKNKLLIETDSPYLSPNPKRGLKNEPSHLIHTATFMSELLNTNLNDLLCIFEENLNQFFGVLGTMDS